MSMKDTSDNEASEERWRTSLLSTQIDGLSCLRHVDLIQEKISFNLSAACGRVINESTFEERYPEALAIQKMVIESLNKDLDLVKRRDEDVKRSDADVKHIKFIFAAIRYISDQIPSPGTSLAGLEKAHEIMVSLNPEEHPNLYNEYIMDAQAAWEKAMATVDERLSHVRYDYSSNTPGFPDGCSAI